MLYFYTLLNISKREFFAQKRSAFFPSSKIYPRSKLKGVSLPFFLPFMPFWYLVTIKINNIYIILSLMLNLYEVFSLVIISYTYKQILLSLTTRAVLKHKKRRLPLLFILVLSLFNNIQQFPYTPYHYQVISINQRYQLQLNPKYRMQS